MPTPRVFRVEEDKDYTVEKNNLVGAVNEFYGSRNKNAWPKHPMFGEFTPQQTGQMMFKHLDHHLRQFGV